MAPQRLALARDPAHRRKRENTVSDISVRAGDPFDYAASRRHDDQERAHGCYDGWVFLGFETEQDGELVEITDRVPCCRCAPVR